ncbi:MAG: methylated-DNA--[protein]-cysteine S-methyltransferase [Burkholderiales bacterium]|nr:methylated-DNA--[protein]-cysteine S-methyltransferase [Burkholderiales bacterium]
MPAFPPSTSHAVTARPAAAPAARRLGPPGCIAQAVVGSPLGDIRLACTAHGLAGLWFIGQRDDPGPAVAPLAAHRWLQQAADELCGYWRRTPADPLPAGRFQVPLDLHGTPFQQAVWRALQAVPEGRTDSYARLAARAGHAGALRAVGAAVGRNPVSIIVPCHRIVASDGRLTGFGGGLPRKLALLRLEGVLPGPMGEGRSGDAQPPIGLIDWSQPELPAAALARLRVPRPAGRPGRGPAPDASAASRPHAMSALPPAGGDTAHASRAQATAQAELPWGDADTA